MDKQRALVASVAVLFLVSTMSVAYASTPQRTFSSKLAVTIPSSGNPMGLAFDSEAPYQGFSEVAVVSQSGSVNFVGPAPSYYRNGSVASYGYEGALNSVPVGFGAGRIIYVPEVNTFYVLNDGENRVIALEGAVYMTNGSGLSPPRVVANMTLGRGPLDECYNPAPGGGAVYVLNSLSGSIGVINATTDRVAGNITVPKLGPVSIACDSWDGALFVTTVTGLLVEVNSTSGTVVSTITPTEESQPITSLTFDSQNGLVYAVDSAERAILIVNPETLKVVGNVTTPGTPGALAVDPSDDVIFASAGNQTLVIDGVTNAVMASFSIPAGPSAFAVDPINKYLYASYEPTNEIAVFAFALGPAPQIVTTTVTATTTEHQTSTTTVSTIVSTTTTATETVQPTGDAGAIALWALLLVVVIESIYLGLGVYRRRTPQPN